MRTVLLLVQLMCVHARIRDKHNEYKQKLRIILLDENGLNRIKVSNPVPYYSYVNYG